MAVRYLAQTTGTYAWSDVALWDGGAAVPAGGDSVVFRNSAVNITGVDESAKTLALFDAQASWTGALGAGSTYMRISASLIRIAERLSGVTGNGCTRFMLDAGANAFSLIQFGSGASADAGLETVRIKGTHASGNNAQILGGSFGMGTTLPTESGLVLNDLNVSSGTVAIASGVTLRNFVGKGADAVRLFNAWHASGIMRQEEGNNLYLLGSGLLPTAYVGGYCYHGQRRSGAATHTDLSILAGGTLDCLYDPRAWTMTNAIKMYAGSRLKLFRPTQITLQAGGAQTYDVQQDDMDEITVESGSHVRFTLGDAA